ncbi:MAG TPA: DUF4920 domain-containing protein [Vicinamibacteria bacterium]|nr:DUF4920 domain-containing protein [Vicinamibacteria bacterium]
MITCILAAFLLAAPPAADVQHFGKPFKDVAPVKLADVLAHPTAGQVVRLEGTVEAVCRNRGCWLTLREGDQSVHVTFEGYSFFVPKDSASKKVVLEGKVLVKEPDAAEVAHLKKEGASAAAAARVSVEAYGVELK